MYDEDTEDLKCRLPIFDLHPAMPQISKLAGNRESCSIPKIFKYPIFYSNIRDQYFNTVLIEMLSPSNSSSK